MSGLRPGQVKLALDVGQSDFEIAHRHVRRAVPEQLHKARQGHTGTKHLGSVCVAKLVRHDAGTNTGGSGYLAQGSTKFTRQHFFPAWAG
jgi:hypothetical protein